MNILRKLASSSLIFLLFSNTVLAQDYFLTSKDKQLYNLKGSEYLSGQNFKQPMMKVNLLGAITKPGVHIIPKNTSMTSLLGFAGGPTKEADIEEIVIKRKKGKGFKVLRYDLDDFVNDTESSDFTLRPYDIVHVPQKENIISDANFKNLAIISTFLGIIVSSLIIDDRI